MKLPGKENVEDKVIDKFEDVPVGTYILQIGEEPKFTMKKEVQDGEAAGPKSFMIPLEITQVLEGEGKVGQKSTKFIMLTDSNGNPLDWQEAKLMSLLKITGVFDKLAAKVGDQEFKPTESNAFKQFLIQNLPGKMLKGIREEVSRKQADGTRKEVLDWTALLPLDAAETAEKATQANEVAADEDDWS